MDQDALEVLVGPAAWAHHRALSGELQVDTARAYRVRGDVRLVAADVLTAAAAATKQTPAGVKRFKVGSVELERQAGGTGQAADWEAAATALRAQVAAELHLPRRPRSVVLSPEVDS